MTPESQIDPEHKRIMLIATSFGFAEYGIIQNVMMQRKQVARNLLEDWNNKTLWDHFHFLEKHIKEYLWLK